MQIRSVGIDLGKTTFHLMALGDNGKVLLKKKFTQKQLIAFTANMQTCLIGMEACSGSHFLGRALRAQGHDVKLIPAQFVKPFVKSNKNDFIDAEAIAEAVERENMRFVAIQTDDQLDLQALHRVRDRLMTQRTALINQIRSFLLERGIVFAKSPIRLREALPEVLENVNENLTPRVECCFGSSPIQAANSRPLRKAAPLPMEATIAVATSGPMPRICRSFRHAASLEAIRSTSSFICTI
jgi:transposase